MHDLPRARTCARAHRVTPRQSRPGHPQRISFAAGGLNVSRPHHVDSARTRRVYSRVCEKHACTPQTDGGKGSPSVSDSSSSLQCSLRTAASPTAGVHPLSPRRQCSDSNAGVGVGGGRNSRLPTRLEGRARFAAFSRGCAVRVSSRYRVWRGLDAGSGWEGRWAGVGPNTTATRARSASRLVRAAELCVRDSLGPGHARTARGVLCSQENSVVAAAAAGSKNALNTGSTQPRKAEPLKLKVSAPLGARVGGSGMVASGRALGCNNDSDRPGDRWGRWGQGYLTHRRPLLETVKVECFMSACTPMSSNLWPISRCKQGGIYQ
ncbi:hypothetical protein B0H11DRAFT_1921227 [Mycena galericulata]|nr:hypothetical protein B0H11DRAFT_1921227 [Mycena galericulata]